MLDERVEKRQEEEESGLAESKRGEFMALSEKDDHKPPPGLLYIYIYSVFLLLLKIVTVIDRVIRGSGRF